MSHAISGEDRRIRAQALPTPRWAWTLSTWVKSDDVERMAALAVERADGQCEVCAKELAPYENMARELWALDHAEHVQRFDGFGVLCPNCASLRNLNAVDQRSLGGLVEHLCITNQWSRARAVRHVMEVVEDASRSNGRIWSIDLSSLRSFGVTLRDYRFRV